MKISQQTQSKKHIRTVALVDACRTHTGTHDMEPERLKEDTFLRCKKGEKRGKVQSDRMGIGTAGDPTMAKKK